MIVRDQDHVYHEFDDIFAVYLFATQEYGIYLDAKPFNVLLGKYATLERAKCVVADLFFAYCHNLKRKDNRKFYMPQDD